MHYTKMRAFPALLILALLIFIIGCAGPADLPVQNQTQIIIENGSEAIPEPAENDLETEVGGDDLVPQPIIEPGPQSAYITLIEGGFEIPEVRIKVGETVVWKNEREGRQQRAMVLGTQWCSTIVRSGFFGPGEVYRATFSQAGTCTVVDGLYTTEMMKVIVEE